MGIFENPTGIFFSAGKLKIPAGMLTLADIFSTTVKYFIMKSIGITQSVPFLCVEVVFRSLEQRKGMLSLPKTGAAKKNRWLLYHIFHRKITIFTVVRYCSILH